MAMTVLAVASDMAPLVLDGSGLSTKYVVVPFPSLQVIDKRVVLGGATKDALKALHQFKYNG